MSRGVVGLDIGTTAVRAVELSTAHGGVVLERLGQVALPPGAVVDGEVADAVAVAEALKELWRRKKFSSKHVHLGVANQRVVVRLTELPWMEEKELRGSLRYQVQEYIPIPVEEAELDVHIIGEAEGPDGQRLLRVVIVAAAKQMIASQLDAVLKAGLRPLGIDLTPFALLRALVPPSQDVLGERCEAILDVGARVTNLVVHEGGVPRFVRIMLMGGQDVTESLRQTLDVSAEDAELAKVGATPALADPAPPVTRAIEQRISALVQEIRSSIDFYGSQAGAPPIDRVLLTGGGSELPVLPDRLSAALQVPVERGHTFASLRLGELGLSPDELAAVEPVTALAVGLALGGVA